MNVVLSDDKTVTVAALLRLRAVIEIVESVIVKDSEVSIINEYVSSVGSSGVPESLM